MAHKDANWFSSYFGWGKPGKKPEETITDRSVEGVVANARDSDEPTAGLKRVWRGMLRKDEAHPAVRDPGARHRES